MKGLIHKSGLEQIPHHKMSAAHKYAGEMLANLERNFSLKWHTTNCLAYQLFADVWF